MEFKIQEQVSDIIILRLWGEHSHVGDLKRLNDNRNTRIAYVRAIHSVNRI